MIACLMFPSVLTETLLFVCIRTKDRSLARCDESPCPNVCVYGCLLYWYLSIYLHRSRPTWISVLCGRRPMEKVADRLKHGHDSLLYEQSIILDEGCKRPHSSLI